MDYLIDDVQDIQKYIQEIALYYKDKKEIDLGLFLAIAETSRKLDVLKEHMELRSLIRED